MKSYYMFIALVLVLIGSQMSMSSSIEVEAEYDFSLAFDYAVRQNIDSLILTTSGGVYTTQDTVPITIREPITIVAQEELAEKPVITHSDPDSNVLEMFRVCNDITVEGVVFDGGHEKTHGMKYALRFGHGIDSDPLAKEGTNIICKNCDFVDIFRDKVTEPEMEEGHAVYFLRPQAPGEPPVKAGTVRIENCTFTNIGDEAIRMTETEKYEIDRCLDTLIVRNCTFTNVDAECVRFYADTDPETEDAYVLVENCTAVNCATRFTYLKNNHGAVVRNIVITHGRLPGLSRLDRTEWVMQVQGPGSYIAYVDTFDLVFQNADSLVFQEVKKPSPDSLTHTYYGFDPLYADRQNGDYTLLPASPAYVSAHDGGVMGDVRWGTNDPTVVLFDLQTEGPGLVTTVPELLGRSFGIGTAVTLTAVADAGASFQGWGGDLSGSEAVKTITVNSETHITATFVEGTVVDDHSPMFVKKYQLEQNYPNPFNPTTQISFALQKDGWTTLKIYNLNGKRVATLMNKRCQAGEYTIQFDASDLSSGIYYYRLESGSFVANKKMLLIK